MASFHVIAGASETLEHTRVRKIGVSDLFDALKRGVDDFMVKPSHIVFLCMIYPLVGVVLATWTSGANTLPLLFPLVSGFALIGPLAAIGLYEISRRREAGLDASWKHAFEVRNSPALPAIAAVGIMLFVIFIAWLLTAKIFYEQLFGPEPPASLSSFIAQIFATGRGWTLIVLGHAIGFVFAAVVLCTTVVAFPLLLDRDVGAYEAIHTSVRVVVANPIVMAVWGLIVAVALIIGSLPVFAGLAVVLPILGHATWHVYRKVVEPPAGSIPAT
ncbi:DUF2189 domain-containing protein [Mesorhizobium sp. M2D.F.Ca.ET.185.01.1.1]|uniref:DUF2189 domain-containing protein n=1 Tax=unclassified Mesorhizobium TaxID=325217 RepID=UPI000FCCD2BE|nr:MULTISPECIES: DUF2189 domain-containing protein [unclassified Mesorhizobium]TGP50469.1 DUF2189 domain-containing protein [bacterium M00.F.Ca.ET.230.01.1.1]TGP79238.1 DUF2189 domain-containing protein [bacterium M00.F.Ca.ET.227.01.1.1]TGQ01025.1 DUF2189 domain-containing protein [bacterium M00.F.Ca.ET.221.01.1.1]TGQ02457.1 DUF2189 domain-containing protein [bacterium M00.F.Ca.ET.222.01.1.1]TGT75572.1 DUF2189 domain-containing protein [bacterium M00.F.Ca.ET.159.01.1.1]TGT81558.1 DUF2189 doma